tara:strand:- start:1756 stop:2328 length:573 start_codon:yes stop_codon:yes gene_type:complete
MQIIKKENVVDKQSLLFSNLKSGKLFIYPTDTIYGIGCDATNAKAVKNLRKVKARPTSPFSIIAPSKDWIKKNCILKKSSANYINKLPGPFTLILKLKPSSKLAKNVNPNLDSVGIRIPNHWIANLTRAYGKPIVTTSVNKAGNKHMTSLSTLNPNIKKQVSFIINEGEKKGKPSTIIDLIQSTPKNISR